MELPEGPSIRIDEYTFTLHLFSKNKGSDFRPCVCYSSIKDGIKTICAAYKSFSEGFWRFATFEGTKFNKGTDYITSTFIHFTLQDFIENNYMYLEERDFLTWYKTIDNSDYDSGRLNTESIFQVLAIIYNTDLPPLIQEIENKMENFNDSNYLRQKFNYNSLFEKTVQKNQSIERRIKVLQDILSKVEQTENIAKLIHNLDVLNKSQVQIDTPYGKQTDKMSTLSRYFETNFSVIDNGKFITSIQLELEPIKLDVYYVKIQSNVDSTIYDLYYIHYVRKEKHFKQPLNILPHNVKINKHGLNSSYYSMGLYLYKIYDYYKQIGNLISNNVNEKYKFIGENFTQLWPMNIVIPNISENRKTVRNVRKRKNAKRTIKYRS